MGGQSQLIQRVHGLRVELGHRFRFQRNASDRPAAGPDQQLVVYEVEINGERVGRMGDRRGRQSAGSHVQGDLPPVIDHGRMSESNLADDLRPHVQCVSRRSPVVEPQARPRAITLRHSQSPLGSVSHPSELLLAVV